MVLDSVLNAHRCSSNSYIMQKRKKKTRIHVNDPNHNDVMSHKYRKLYGSVDWPDPVEILLY